MERKRDSMSELSSAPVAQDWSKEIEAVLPTIPEPTEEEPVIAQLAHSLMSDSIMAPPAVGPSAVVLPPPPPVPEVPATSPEPETGRNVNSWMAGAINNSWDVEPRIAEGLAGWGVSKEPSEVVPEQTSTSDSRSEETPVAAVNESPTEEPPAEPWSSSVEVAAAPGSSHSSITEELPAIESLLSSETKEILQEETAHLVAEEQIEPAESAYSGTIRANEPTVTPAPDMDDIVAKVLAKMNPEVLQAVTREILKPLVEAMVKDEIAKK